MPKKQVPVRLDAARLKRFEEYAESSGLKKQTILERALDQYMSDNPLRKARAKQKRSA